LPNLAKAVSRPRLSILAREVKAPRNMSNLESLATHLIQQGHWTEAVHLYRDELGLSLQQAEQIVVQLADETGISYPGRFLYWLALTFAGLSLFGLAGILHLIVSK
jgi:hypothetical protein